MSAIRFENVTKAFDGVKVLDGLSFVVEPGELVAVVGPSGTGKSVTLKHVVGLLQPDAGTVETASDRIGYLFQSGALLAWMSVWDNVALPLRETTRLSAAEIARKVDAALAAVGLTAAADRFPAEISGGMQKRAGLARSIVLEADVILYDEPTSGLDPVTAKAIDRLIVALNRERGITSVVVTHDVASALGMADRILLLADGKAAFCGTPAEFRVSAEPQVREFVEALRGREA
ncbi:MAG: ABC transporter ATP-binding protein [Kiritimatiellia bacterium]